MIKARMSQAEIQTLEPWEVPPTVDYHNFCYRDSSKEHRERLHLGTLYLNAATCKICGYFIRSRNRHDFVRCRCGAIAVDGGSWYARRIGNPDDMVNHIETFTDLETEHESELSN